MPSNPWHVAAAPKRCSPVTPLIGRVAEKAVFERALDALQAGRSGMVLVEGEAGIGKTRLMEHLRVRAGARELATLNAGADSADRKRSYGAWRPAVEGLLDALGPDLATEGSDLLTALEALDPELVSLAPLLEAFLPPRAGRHRVHGRSVG